MKSTCRDFWKMVYDRECGVIVMLSDLVENGEVGRTEVAHAAVQSLNHYHITAGGVLPVLAC